MRKMLIIGAALAAASSLASAQGPGKLRGMYGAEKLDADKLVEQQKKVDALRQQMFKSRIEAHNQIATVLTPEQRKQLRQFAPGWFTEDE